ncbi:MAG: hypothetical protein RBU45_00915 [Myxococcota bacterium]|jgi:hypothetical protein|nr:hypothetical protein [Myxococcota bacterium]
MTASTGLLVTLTLSPQGQLYLHDLTPELLEVLLQVCPGDPELAARAQHLAALPPPTPDPVAGHEDEP